MILGWVTQPPTRPEYRLSFAQWRTAMCKRLGMALEFLVDGPCTLLLDAAGSPDATRGATPARTRMASATCPTRILECPCLAIPECHRCERGAARGNSSLLQSPAAGVDSHAPVDSETDLTLAV